MPGPAPAKVQHIAIKISVKTQSEVTPIWDEDTGRWIIELTETQNCDKYNHALLEWETDKSYEDCDKGKHAFAFRIVFRQVGKKCARRWKTRGYVSFDDEVEIAIPVGRILSLLSSPTNPTGDGKVASAAEGSNKQNMDVKRTTVIRV